jgi:hypothetical protein
MLTCSRETSSRRAEVCVSLGEDLLDGNTHPLNQDDYANDDQPEQ